MSRKSNRRRALRRQRFVRSLTCGLESLERRDLLAGSILHDPATGRVTVRGTDAADEAFIGKVKSTSQILVSLETDGQVISKTFDKSEVQLVVYVARGGNDELNNKTSIPTIAYGGDGNDKLKGGKGDDKLYGGNDNDRLIGGSGNDTLSGGAGRDKLSGKGGDDRLLGGDDRDKLSGGSGNDVSYGGNGNDVIDGGRGNDLASGQNGDDKVVGGKGQDTVYGASGNDRLEGGPGNDVLNGGIGDDTARGGDDDDTVYGSSGDDDLYGDAGNDLLNGGTENDVVMGGSGMDTVYGSAGNDYLDGEGDEDLVNGGAGNDIILGGDGNDSLYGSNGADSIDGEEGDDLVNGGNDDDLLEGGSGADTMYGANGNDWVHGGGDNDTAHGNGGNDIVAGGEGNDYVNGGWDHDVVLGGAGEDDARGSRGSDLLIGGADADLLRGDHDGDIVIGSSTDYDTNRDALAAIRDVWSSDDTYANRIARLQDQLFAFPLQSETSVWSDGVPDDLYGWQGEDWYFLPGSYDQKTATEHFTKFLGTLDNIHKLEHGEKVDAVVPHANNAVMRFEHFAVFDLVHYSNVDVEATRSGPWTDPSIWSTGSVPGTGSNVLIPKTVEVTVDAVLADDLKTLRVEGDLVFDPGVDSRLGLDLMVVGGGGSVTMGTEAAPIGSGVTAQLVVAGSGPIDRNWDPLGFSRGVISHGSFVAHGEQKTTWLELGTYPRRGDTELNLSEVPENWRVGDRLVLAGTHRTRNQDEEREILAINGRTVTVAPLEYSHTAPNGQPVHVANLTRNAQVLSETPGANQGHLMFMHSRNVEIAFMGAYDLGRTNKLVPANDSQVDENYELVDGTGTNQRGRYGMHFHRTGVHHGEPSHIEGAVVEGSRGWGFVNHSSHAHLINNVAYDVTGASFVTEAGDELGTFVDNIAIHSEGSTDGIGHRVDVQDFGHQGDGFWFQGGGVEVTGNVAAGQSGNGFVFFTRGLIQEGLGRTMFPAENLEDPSIANGKKMVFVGEVPLREFSDNQAYGSRIGMATRFHKLRETHDQVSVLENLEIWNNRLGLNIPYTHNVIVRNVEIVGSENNPWGVGINRNNVTRNITYEDVTVRGFRDGIRVPTRGSSHVNAVTLENLNNIVVRTGVRSDRVVHISNAVDFQTPDPAALRGRTPYNVRMEARFTPMQESIEHVFSTDTVFLELPDGRVRQLYYFEQREDFVPFPEAGEFIPAEYVGKSNGELWAEFDKAIGGAIAPADAEVIPGVYGLAGLPRFV